MNTTAVNSTAPAPLGLKPDLWWAEALRRERTLALFALFMALAILPTLVAMGLDERLFRGASIWAKPLKFMASLSLFAISTGWFTGLLPASQRASRALRLVVWTIVIAGAAEVAYITWQAALGQPSHYNRNDALHRALYQAMGVLAMALMLTQPVLAWQIARHGRKDIHPLWRTAVVLGLVMTFVLGVGAAVPLASAQPPSGAGVLILGWHLAGGDLRPAHFIGSHAQQFIPLAGWLLLQAGAQRGRKVLWGFAAAYTLLWLAAMQLASAAPYGRHRSEALSPRRAT